MIFFYLCMDNQKIAQIFQEIADILEIQGENRFRVLAYQKAAQNILDMPHDLKDIYQQDPKKLLELPGIGKDLASKIEELIKTGKCEWYEKLLKSFDRGLLDLLRVRGVGPKKVKLFYSELQINSVEKLKVAAEKGLLRNLPKMGEKSEAEILKALSEYERHTERMMLNQALQEVEKIVNYMRQCKLARRVEYAGSLRRMRETVGDLDILVAVKNPEKDAAKVMEYFAKYEDVETVIGSGGTKSSVILKSGVQSDLRVLDEKVFGAAWHYFTGSKDHNVAIRDRAKKMGMKVSEYGVFKLKTVRGHDEPAEILIGGKTEEEVFKAVGLPYIIPEMRENRGEIEAGLAGILPQPIELKDLRGDLHVHSKWSDGANEIEDIARAYRDAGFEYIALTDHSPAVAVAHGLTPERFEMRKEEIDEINADLAREHEKWQKNGRARGGAAARDAKLSTGQPVRPFKILNGVECDIMADGSMDLPDSVLKYFDIVIASVHSRFNLSMEEQTARVLKAFKNPYVKIFGHPSGRLINQREPYAIDMEKIINAAVENGIALEIDGQPARLDLFDYYCKLAKEKGAFFTVDSDSHNYMQMSFLRYGISVARRGWLTKTNVLNTMPLEELMKFFDSE